MKFNKVILGLICASTLTLTSCYDEEGDEYTPANAESGAYLYAKATSLIYAAEDEQVLTMSVGRTDSTLAQTVSIVSDNAAFSVPSTISFAVGEVSKEVEVPFSMQGGTTEEVTFTITEGTTSYGPSVLTFSVTRDYVWVNIGMGTFTSDFFEEAWDQPVLQREGSNVYRLPDLYTEGYNVEFELTEDGQALVSPIKAFATGVVHPTYGMVYARNIDLEKYPMVRDENSITIPLQFYVSAGAFGWADETIKLP